MPLQVELVAVDHKVWAGQGTMVIARTTEGDIGILPGHEPLLAVLAGGELKVNVPDGEPVVAAMDDGFLSVEHDRVTVVSDSARLVSAPAAG